MEIKVGRADCVFFGLQIGRSGNAYFLSWGLAEQGMYSSSVITKVGIHPYHNHNPFTIELQESLWVPSIVLEVSTTGLYVFVSLPTPTRKREL